MKRMNKVISLLMAATMVVGCAQKKETKAQETRYMTYNDMVKNYVDALDMKYAYDLTYKLAYDETLGGSNGFRTSGSTYEHDTADYLVSVMEELGLEEIVKVPLTVDLWQFDSSSLTIEGTDIHFEPASYAQNGTDKDGITAQIVNVGDGLAVDYEDVDVEGKIVLAGIDQRNIAWIDGYIQEAALHGAKALVTYDVGGYSQFSQDIRNIQDVCTKDIMPTVSCTYNEAMAIIDAIENGNDTCTLNVDCTVDVDGGTSYTVAGRIKGKSSDQQIIYAGHYDKYFYGFQDDCSAISCIMTIAKAMKDSNYVPENDIVIVCHPSEEWGASNTQFDWTTGAWETVNNETDWADKTIALYNFELCAYKEDTMDAAYVAAVPELSTFVAESTQAFNDLIDTKVYENGISNESIPTQTMEDGISYRNAGVPYVLNGVDFTDELSFAGQKYHSEADCADTWDENVMKMNSAWFGMMGILTDQNPALELDMTNTVAWLEETLDEEFIKEAGYDLDSYKATLKEFSQAVESLYASAVEVNTNYEQAKKDNDEEAMKSLRAQGKDINAKSLEVFQIIQDTMVGIKSSSTIVSFHEGYEENLMLLAGALQGIEDEVDWADDELSGALDCLWPVNDMIAYDSVIFSKENAEYTYYLYSDDADLWWGTNKVIQFVDIDDAIRAINENGDFQAAKPIVEKAYADTLAYLNEYMTSEEAGMKQVIDLLK